MDKYGYSDFKDKRKLSKEEILNFWKNPVNKSKNENNSPDNYLEGEDRSLYLVDLINKYLAIDSHPHILELGCNVGRNLNGLYKAGYFNLTGIEINKEAFDLMKSFYSILFENIVVINSSIEEAIPNIRNESYDLVFTMAVFEHIHYDSEFIFSHVKRITKKFIITIEDEVTSWSERHFPRNYKKVFEDEIWEQVYEEDFQKHGILDDRFMIRVFARK